MDSFFIFLIGVGTICIFFLVLGMLFEMIRLKQLKNKKEVENNGS